MSQGTLVNSTHCSPSRQACQQFPGVLAKCLCSSETCLCTHVYGTVSRLWLCIYPHSFAVRIASNVGFGTTRPARLAAFQLTALCRWRRADRLCDQGSACGLSEAFPASGGGSHSTLRAPPPAVRPRAEISIARRHHRLHDEGIVDSRELARNLIPKPVLASSRPAIASRLSPATGPPLARLGLSKQRDA